MSADRDWLPGIAFGVGLTLMALVILAFGLKEGRKLGETDLCRDALVRGVDREAVVAVCGEERIKVEE